MRLPLLSPASLSPEQQKLSEDMRQGIESNFKGFQAINSEGALIGPWNPWLRFSKFGGPIWELDDSGPGASLQHLDARILRCAHKGHPKAGSRRVRLDRKLRPARFQLGADRIDVRYRKPDVLQPKVGRMRRSGRLRRNLLDE